MIFHMGAKHQYRKARFKQEAGKDTLKEYLMGRSEVQCFARMRDHSS
jgi:hypothetical protein